MPLLPPIPGPKLHPFRAKPVDIDFIEEIGRGLHSIVFKASLDDSLYALKIVRTTNSVMIL